MAMLHLLEKKRPALKISR